MQKNNQFQDQHAIAAINEIKQILINISEQTDNQKKMQYYDTYLGLFVQQIQRTYSEQIEQYNQSMIPEDLIMKKTQTQVIEILQKSLQQFIDKDILQIHKLSSLDHQLNIQSSDASFKGCNHGLVSDIDISILIDGQQKDYNKTQGQIIEILIQLGYQFHQFRNIGKDIFHMIFQKKHDGILIEVKLYSKQGFQDCLYIHDYLINDMDSQTKKTLRYIKWMCSKDKQSYGVIKQAIYYQAMRLVNVKNKQLGIPQIDVVIDI